MTVDGARVHPGYLKGERIRESKWNWPRWKPPRRTWDVWNNGIRSYLSNKLLTKEDPLGHQHIMRGLTERKLKYPRRKENLKLFRKGGNES